VQHYFYVFQYQNYKKKVVQTQRFKIPNEFEMIKKTFRISNLKKIEIDVAQFKISSF